MKRNLHYLDYNSTTPLAPEVLEAMAPYWCDRFYNASSAAGDIFGIQAIIESAKESVSALVGGTPKEVFFTSGATESNNWALRGTVSRRVMISGKCKLAISTVEHPSVLETAKTLARADPRVEVTLIPVNSEGIVTVKMLEDLLCADTDLVSIMHANNETGTVQPIGKLSSVIKDRAPHCIIHTDATQSVGKIPIDFSDEFALVDLLSLSAHKINGPKGVGALIIRQGIHIDALITGGGQQGEMRSGTVNTPLIVGLGAACDRLVRLNIKEAGKSLGRAKERLEEGLLNLFPGSYVVSEDTRRLPNTTLLILPDIEGEMAIHSLLEQGIVASTGSACSSGADKPSHVLLAMGQPYGLARNALRLSFGLEDNLDVNELLPKIEKALKCC